MDIKSYFASKKELNPSQIELAFILQSISDYFNSRKIIRYFRQLPYNGTYIYGKVGSGKTMLMQALNQSLEKLGEVGYFHYQFLMHSLHKVVRHNTSKHTDNSNNLMKTLAYEYSSKYRIILIDEFEITDIAEALLIGSFIKWLFIKKVYIVLTSNIAPELLYNNGLKRELFLPYIDTIKKNMQIFYLKSDHDYRKAKVQSKEQRILIGIDANKQLQLIIDKLIRNKELLNHDVKVLGRNLNVNNNYGNILIITFDELCYQERSYNDYIAMCQHFDVIIVKNVTIIESANNDVIIRFINFIDNAYSMKVLIYMSVNTSLDQIYIGHNYQQPFQRTLSRLYEMNSNEYLFHSKYQEVYE